MSYEARSAHVTIGGRNLELVLTTRATRLIAERYGGLENLGKALEDSDDIAKSLTEVTWLIALLANQSILIHNLTHPDDKQPELTADELEILTVPGDLAGYKDAISAALVKGTKREILSDPKAPTPVAQ
ncbi:hypothetical protein ACTOVL_04305 [Arcanobacterium canis]